MHPTATATTLVTLILTLAGPPPTVGGEIDWQPHEIRVGERTVEAETGRLAVPQDHRGQAASDAPEVELALLRLRATGPDPGPPLVYLAGGPGGSGIGTASWLYPVYERLRELGDVILLDQRGTGASTPLLACRPSSEAQPEWFATMEELETWALDELAACAEEFRAEGFDPARFHTAASADDLEALRRALGAEKLSLLGFSYGTHLALAALRRHPDSFARAVLVGVEGPDHTRKLPSSLDTHFRRLALLAAEDGSIAGQVPDAAALLERLAERLDEEPMPVEIEGPEGEPVVVPLGGTFLRYIVLRDMGDGNDTPVLPALLATIDRGDPSLARWFVSKRAPQLVRWAFLVHFAVDGASGASPERWARIERESEGSLFGPVANLLFPAAAERLGLPDLGEELRSPLVSDVPTLFLSGTLDANAPPYQAEEVRWGFAFGEHLVVENAGHEDILGDPAVTEVIADFLAGERVQGRHLAVPAPDFLSIEDAKRDRGVGE